MRQFYLTGGTALPLHLGHRQSRDLAFFTRNSLGTLPPLTRIDDILSRFEKVEWELNTPEQIQWRLDAVSVKLLVYLFPHQFGYQTWQGLAVADDRGKRPWWQVDYSQGEFIDDSRHHGNLR